MVSASIVVIPVNVVYILATKSIVGRAAGVTFSSSSLSSSVML